MKKLLSLMMAVSLIVGVFAGCSAKEEAEAYQLQYTVDGAFSDCGESALSLYNTLCKGVEQHEETIRLNTGMLDEVTELFYTSCPLTYLVKTITVNEDNSGVTVTYHNDADKHQELVNTFAEKLEEMLTACQYHHVSDAVFAVNAYHYVAEHIQVSDNPSVTLFESVVNGTGNAFSYSAVFAYLLQLAGISACHMTASDAAGAAWCVSGVALDDGFYYCDVMSEFYANNGQQLTCFGMTAEELENTGLHDVRLVNNGELPAADNPRFDACRFCKAWEIKENALLITRSDDVVVEIAL